MEEWRWTRFLCEPVDAGAQRRSLVLRRSPPQSQQPIFQGTVFAAPGRLLPALLMLHLWAGARQTQDPLRFETARPDSFSDTGKPFEQLGEAASAQFCSD